MCIRDRINRVRCALDCVHITDLIAFALCRGSRHQLTNFVRFGITLGVNALIRLHKTNANFRWKHLSQATSGQINTLANDNKYNVCIYLYRSIRWKFAHVLLLFSSVRDSNCALWKAHMRPIPSLRHFLSVAFETVPMFVWLTMTLSCRFREERPAHPLSTSLFSRRSMVLLLLLCFRSKISVLFNLLCV